MPRNTKRKNYGRKKGGSDTHTSTTASIPYQQNALPDGASSTRDAAMISTSNMNNNQQNMIDTHGGKKRRYVKKVSRKNRIRSYKRKAIRNLRKTKRKIRSYKRKAMRKLKKTKRNARSLKRRLTRRRNRRGGSGDSGQAVTVPSFSNSGSDVSPINANSMSQTSNTTNLNANSQASNDCYATGTCKQSGGFRIHYEVFPSKSLTGSGRRSRTKRAGKKSVKWGCMSGGKGNRDINGTVSDPNRPDMHGRGGLIERMFGN